MTDEAQQDTPPPVDAVTATTPPVGVSTKQIFSIAAAVFVNYTIAQVITWFIGTPSDRAAFAQSTINLATLAAGYYLGSSASSRNKEH